MNARLRWITIVAGGLAVGSLTTTGIIVLGHHGTHAPGSRGGPSASTSVEVTGATAGTTFTIATAAGPTLALPGMTALTSAYEISPSGDPGAAAQIRVHLDPSRMPPGEPSCATPTTGINLGILVYNAHVQGWVPVPTTCTGHDLVATAPHFSTFLAATLDAGSHAVSATFRGASFVVHVATTTATSIVSYVADVMREIVVTALRNVTGTFDDSKFACAPASTRHSAKVVTVAGTDRSPTIAGCVVGTGAGDEFRLRNGLAIPLALDLPARSQSYLTPGSGDPSGVDLFGLLESAAAYARGKLLVPGLEVGTLRLGAQTPDSVAIPASADQPSLMIDLVVAALSVIAPAFRTEQVAMREIVTVVDSRLLVIAARDGYRAISLTTVTTVIRDVTAERPAWGAYAEDLLDVVAMVKCLTSHGTDAASVAQIAFNCAATVFGGAGSELRFLLLTLATQLKVVPELIEADLAHTFRTATGIDITRVDITISSSLKLVTVAIDPMNWSGTESSWDVLGPTAEENPQVVNYGATYTHAYGNDTGQFGYDFVMRPFAGTRIQVSAQLSANFPYYSAPPDGYSDVTLVVNGTALPAQRVIPDDGTGRVYRWTFDAGLVKVGANRIAFQVRPDAAYRNGLCIYYHALLPGQPDRPIQVQTLH